MLRNPCKCRSAMMCWLILNEVLSLNAQEFQPFAQRNRRNCLLNEVLSLNAQELTAGLGLREEVDPQ